METNLLVIGEHGIDEHGIGARERARNWRILGMSGNIQYPARNQVSGWIQYPVSGTKQYPVLSDILYPVESHIRYYPVKY